MLGGQTGRSELVAPDLLAELPLNGLIYEQDVV